MSALDFLDDLRGQALSGELESAGGCEWKITEGTADLISMTEKTTKNGKSIIEVVLESSEGIASFALITPSPMDTPFVKRKKLDNLMAVVIGATGKKASEISFSQALKSIAELPNRMNVKYFLREWSQVNDQTGDMKKGVSLASLQFNAMKQKPAKVPQPQHNSEDDVPF